MHVLLVVQNSLFGRKGGIWILFQPAALATTLDFHMFIGLELHVVCSQPLILSTMRKGRRRRTGLTLQSGKSVDNQVQQEHQYSDSISEIICLEAFSLLISQHVQNCCHHVVTKTSLTVWSTVTYKWANPWTAPIRRSKGNKWHMTYGPP